MVIRTSITEERMFTSLRQTHPYHEVLLCLTGTGSITVNGTAYSVSAGDVVCIPAGMEHVDDAFTPRKNGFLIFDEQYNIHNELIAIPELTIFHDDDGRFTRLFLLTYESQQASERNNSFGEALLHLLQYCLGIHGRNQPALLVHRAIQLNYANSDFSLTEEIEKTGYSASHFRRLFKEAYGCPPLVQLNRVRIGHARALMEQGERSIAQISQACGFRDPYYFSRLFRQIEGLSPKEALTRLQEAEVQHGQ